MGLIIKEEEFTITKYEEEIVKTLCIYSEKDKLCNLVIESLPDFLDSITISIHNVHFFKWKRDEIIVPMNLLESSKYEKIQEAINTSEYMVNIHFIYDQKAVYKKCGVMTHEVTTPGVVPKEDKTKLVTYWDPDDECACQAYGVKYEMETKQTKILLQEITLRKPQVKISYI